MKRQTSLETLGWGALFLTGAIALMGTGCSDASTSGDLSGAGDASGEPGDTRSIGLPDGEGGFPTIDAGPAGNDGKGGALGEPGGLCWPCSADTDCPSLGALCVGGDEEHGRFCGMACEADDGACPDGFTCELLDRGGESVGQCRPESGTCECSEAAISEGATTPCVVSNQHGACDGVRACGAKGLGDCDAVAPEAETCNEVDDDCDGEIDEEGCETPLCDPSDEAACDDGVGCTLDTCDPAVGCSNDADDSLCEDGVDCTTNACDVANDCVYVPDSTACDDGAVCTEDVCDSVAGCVFGVDESVCDDGNPCTSELCVPFSGCTIVEEATEICDDSVECTIDSCTLEDGCFHDADAGACDDGTACTVDSCDTVSGCSHALEAALCADGVGCTVDECTPEDGCVNTINDAFCDDEIDCTVDTCALVTGGCAYAAQDDACDDDLACTVNSCDPSQGCGVITLDSECDDGVACTLDTCEEDTGCFFALVDSLCDDGEICTTDSCTLTGCATVHADVGCDDGSVCTDLDACQDGECAGEAVTCSEDGNPCTEPVCDSVAGCGQDPADNPCSDDDQCTTQDGCASGTCVGEPTVCATDGNPCTNDVCDPTTGDCGVVLDDGAPCSDGEICTLSDKCVGGTCQGSDVTACESGENVLCVIDLAQEIESALACELRLARATSDVEDAVAIEMDILYSSDAVLQYFSDGEFCTPAGCIPYTLPTPFQTLNDGQTLNLAPQDLPLWDGGGKLIIVSLSQPGLPLSDAVMGPEGVEGDPVFLTAHFDSDPGAAPAAGFVLVTLDDAIVSTPDGAPFQWYVEDGTVVYWPYPVSCLAPGEPCDDGDACTTADLCTAGACVGGAPLDCDDQNPCTVDSCDPVSGCVSEDECP